MLSIGIDISKKKVDVAIYDGMKYVFETYENSVRGVKGMLRKIKKREPIDSELVFVMEATGVYHLRYADSLYESGYKVCIVNPLIIKRYGEEKLRRAKTDKADAKLISEFGYYNIIRFDSDAEDKLPYQYSPNSEVSSKVKLMLKAIEQLQRQKNKNINYVEALKQHKKEYSKDLIKMFNDINRETDKKIKKLEKKTEKLIVESEEHKETYDKLLKIPGIGKRTAGAVIGYFDKFDNFENAKQVAAYIGLNPRIRESGTSIKRKGKISRIGNAYLRKLFYMDALSASQYNVQCKSLYERLLMKGKDKPKIFMAVGHKLLRQMFAVAKYDRDYDPNY